MCVCVLHTVVRSKVFAMKENSVVDSVGKKFPTEIVLISAEKMFTGRKWDFRGDQEILWKMCLMYSEGFDQVYGSTTRAVTQEMATRQGIRYLGLHQRVIGLFARERMRICRLLLCCVQNLSNAGLLPTRRLRTVHQVYIR